MELNDAIKIAKHKLGEEIFSNLNLAFKKKKDKGYLEINRKNNDIEIIYGELSSLFRALTFIKENINKESYNEIFHRNFDKNGFMLDCSRNGVANLETIKEIILIEALMGQNRLLLYTEDTYKLDKYPYFGYLRGGYTKEEIKEIVNYASSFGIEVVPCIQTLGHLGRPLHWEPMIPLRDGPTTLLAENEDVYVFIEEMIKFSKECFKTNEIHIGMDESTEMGLGRYLGQHKYKERIELFSKHLERVIKICEKYKFSPMIWSDMFFRLNNKDEEYYRSSPLPASTIKLIPEGVSLVYWDYYHEDKKTYDDMIKYHRQAKNNLIFAGGAWRWKGFTPAVKKTNIYSSSALKSCIDNKLRDVFCTAWGDNGNECSIFTVLPTLALYSTMDFSNSDDREDVTSLLSAITGNSLKDFELLDLPDMPNNECLCPSYNPSKYFFYQDPLNGIFDNQVKDNFASNYKDHALSLLEASYNSKDYGYVYKTLSTLCDILSIKVDLGVRLRKAYKENNKKVLKKISKKDIPYIVSKLDILNDLHKAQWDKENKTFGYDVLDGRYGYLKNRIITVKKTIDEYLKGKIKNIPELETEILPYNGHDYEISWNWWLTTVTVNNL